MRQRSRILATASRYRFFGRPSPPSPDAISPQELDSSTALSSPIRLSENGSFQGSTGESPASDSGPGKPFGGLRWQHPYFPPLELAEPLDAESMFATISMHMENDESFWQASDELAQTMRQTAMWRGRYQATIITSVYASDDYCGPGSSGNVAINKGIEASDFDVTDASVSTVIVHPVDVAKQEQPELGHPREHHDGSSPTLSSPTDSVFSTTPEELSSSDTDRHESERPDASSSVSPAPSPPRVPRGVHCFHHNRFEQFCAACLMEQKQSVILERKRLQIMDALLQSVEDENRATTSAKARYLGYKAARIVTDMMRGKELHVEE
ncbi:hypothetical protein V1525DRAFT_424141 [Lipomyces kononenkoae]|uniref:Uncharacterized protein n=1 Tax=Lipomyces kononenkoae TaxID=34357 RepID=A0ACC3T8D5_LIPKO